LFEVDYQILDLEKINQLTAAARTDQRRRKNYNFHHLSDNVQRMLNAIEPDSYVRPHRHLQPPKIEMFVLLTGQLAVFIFDDDGSIKDIIRLSEKGNRGIDISAGIWHSIVSMQPGTVVFEVKDGPYEMSLDKDFAYWAPAEDDPGAAEYLKSLKTNLD